MKALITILFAFCASISSVLAYAKEIHIEVRRTSMTSGCTQGLMTVDGGHQFATLELTYENNAPNVSSIPTGTYSASIDFRDHLGWVLALKDVPGRTGVLIHVGSHIDNTEGCLLVGTHPGANDCSFDPGDSGVALGQLRKLSTTLQGEYDPSENQSYLYPATVDVLSDF